MKTRSLLILCALIGSALFAACDASGGTPKIDCVGFTVTDIALYNANSSAGYFNAVAHDANNVQIFNGPVGPLVPPHTTDDVIATISGTWTTPPALGPIVLKVGDNNMTYTGTCGGQSGRELFTDGRINPDALATVVGYCTKNHGIIAYKPPYTPIIFSVTADQIAAGLAQAVSAGHPVKLAEASGQQLWALPSNEMQFVNGAGVPNLYTSAPFPANRCSK